MTSVIFIYKVPFYWVLNIIEKILFIWYFYLIIISDVRIVVKVDFDPGFEYAIDSSEIVRVTINHRARVEFITSYDL